MSAVLQQRRQVLFPDVLGPARPSLSQRSSQSSSVLLRESLYDDGSFVSTLKRAHESFQSMPDELLVDDATPSSLQSQMRVERILEILKHHVVEDSNELPQLVGITAPRCRPQPVSTKRVFANARSVPVIFPLADDDAQWDRWVQGVEKAPQPLSQTEADKWNSLMAPVTSSGRGQTAASGSLSLSSHNATLANTQSMVAQTESQDVSISIGPLPPPRKASVDASFDFDHSIVSSKSPGGVSH